MSKIFSRVSEGGGGGGGRVGLDPSNSTHPDHPKELNQKKFPNYKLMVEEFLFFKEKTCPVL